MLKGYSYQEGSHVRRRHGETKQDWPAGGSERTCCRPVRSEKIWGGRRQSARLAGDGELDGVYSQFGLAAAAAGREGKWKGEERREKLAEP